MTNGNKIREMTDEEIAEFLERLLHGACIIICDAAGIDRKEFDEEWDAVAIYKEELDFLRREVKEETL